MRSKLAEDVCRCGCQQPCEWQSWRMHFDIYGIPNCDTIKKARRWLDQHDVTYQFHDYRKEGVDRQQLERWVSTLGWEVLLNRRGTTWRKLDESSKNDIDGERAITLMIEHPAMIKRPVLEHSGGIEVGFSADRYAELLT